MTEAFSVSKIVYETSRGLKAELTPTLYGAKLGIGARLDFKKPGVRKKPMPYYFEKPVTDVTLDEIAQCRDHLEKGQPV